MGFRADFRLFQLPCFGMHIAHLRVRSEKMKSPRHFETQARTTAADRLLTIRRSALASVPARSPGAEATLRLGMFTGNDAQIGQLLVGP